MEIIKGEKKISTGKPLLFQQYQPTVKLLVSVIIPVRNEAEHLTNTLDALRLQLDDAGMELDKDIYEVLLLANNCSDQSFRIATDYQEQFPSFNLRAAEVYLPKNIANIGTVRCMLMDEACRRLMAVGNANGIIASTDGDSEVDPRWIFNILHEINKGNDAVGGRIITKRYDNQSCEYYLKDEIYRSLIARAESIADPMEHDPWPRHFQYFGANLAVTCNMYQQVGGIPQLPWLEDEAFYKALVRHDAKIRKSMNVMVTTSDRHEGRVDIGFSQQLREWSEMKKSRQPQLVTSAEELIAKFSARRQLRECWLSNNQQEIKLIADKLFIDPSWLYHEMNRSEFFGKLWEQVEAEMASGKWATSWALVDISVAIEGLKYFNEPKTFFNRGGEE